MLTEAQFVTWYSGRVRRRTGRIPSEKTVRSKASRLRTCLRLAEAQTFESLANMLADRCQLAVVIDKVHAQLGAQSAVQTIQTLRDAGEWLTSAGVIDGHKVLPADWPARPKQKPMTVYTDAEVATLVAASRGRSLRWWAFLSTLADTGRRVSEILDLRWPQLKLDADPAHIDLLTTKNGKQQYVPLTLRLREEVYTSEHVAILKCPDDLRKTLRHPETYPFPWGYASAQDRMKAFCRAVGIEYRGFHVFRHSRATSLLAKGVPLHAVSSLLGHASVSTTFQTYSHATSLDYARYIEPEAAQ